MENIYFKLIGQKAGNGKVIIVAAIPEDMLGDDLPSIFEFQAVKTPATIYSGIYPTIRVISPTLKDRTEELKGQGIDGILTSEEWYNKIVEEKDHMGIELKK